MITAISVMRINEILKRKDDLLVSTEDIKELVRNTAIDMINECIKITNECCWKDTDMLVELFEQLKEKVYR